MAETSIGCISYHTHTVLESIVETMMRPPVLDFAWAEEENLLSQQTRTQSCSLFLVRMEQNNPMVLADEH
jgi:hypothetical protein